MAALHRLSHAFFLANTYRASLCLSTASYRRIAAMVEVKAGDII
jgi:hypothetical protein